MSENLKKTKEKAVVNSRHMAIYNYVVSAYIEGKPKCRAYTEHIKSDLKNPSMAVVALEKTEEFIAIKESAMNDVSSMLQSEKVGVIVNSLKKRNNMINTLDDVIVDLADKKSIDDLVKVVKLQQKTIGIQDEVPGAPAPQNTTYSNDGLIQ